MDLKTIDFRQNKSFIKAARATRWLLQPWFRFLSSLLVILGFILFLNVYQNEDANLIAGPVALSIFFFMLLKFSGSYFRRLELRNVCQKSLGNNVSIFECT